MRNLLHRIAEAIRREPAAFARIDHGAKFTDVPRGRQDDELDRGHAPEQLERHS